MPYRIPSQRYPGILATLATTAACLGYLGCGTVSVLSGPSTWDAVVDGSSVMAGDMPDNEYCAAVATWPAESIRFEDEVLDLVNAHRATGAVCGDEGSFAAAEPLAMDPALRCAARNHSLDMATRGFFDHIDPDGRGPASRMEHAGYHGSAWGENIAFGQSSPTEVVNGWMDSPGHCANIMNPNFAQIGVGYNSTNHWTQVFGAE